VKLRHILPNLVDLAIIAFCRVAMPFAKVIDTLVAKGLFMNIRKTLQNLTLALGALLFTYFATIMVPWRMVSKAGEKWMYVKSATAPLWDPPEVIRDTVNVWPHSILIDGIDYWLFSLRLATVLVVTFVAYRIVGKNQ